jgi:hypothetical protein
MLVKLPNKIIAKTSDFTKLLILKTENNFVLDKKSYLLERFPPILIKTNTYT